MNCSVSNCFIFWLRHDTIDQWNCADQIEWFFRCKHKQKSSDRQTDKKINKQTNQKTQTDRQTNKHTNRQTNQQTHKQTDKPTNTQPKIELRTCRIEYSHWRQKKASKNLMKEVWKWSTKWFLNRYRKIKKK
jgi:hypothetical protein